MRRSRFVSAILLASFTVQATACKSFQPLEAALPSTAETASRNPRVRVTTEDEETFDLNWVHVDSLTLWGQRGPRRSGGQSLDQVSLPRSAIVSMEDRRFDLKKTLLVTGIGVPLLALAVHLIIQSNEGIFLQPGFTVGGID